MDEIKFILIVTYYITSKKKKSLEISTRFDQESRLDSRQVRSANFSHSLGWSLHEGREGGREGKGKRSVGARSRRGGADELERMG